MECTKMEQVYCNNEIAAVETNDAVDKQISDREMANYNADTGLHEEQVIESMGSLQSDWNHAENITVKVIYSNVGFGSPSLVTSDVGDVRLAETFEPVSSEENLSPDYQAVSLLLNFKEQDRSVPVSDKGTAGLARALPKLQAPTLPVAGQQCYVERIIKEQSSKTAQCYGTSLPQLSRDQGNDFSSDLDTISQTEHYQKSVQSIDSLEPISGPEVEISSLAEVYTSSLSTEGDTELVMSELQQTHCDSKPNDNPDEDFNEEDEDTFQNSLNCKDQCPNDDSGADSNDETAVKDEVDLDATSNSRLCTEACAVKKVPGAKRTFQRCSLTRSTKQLPAFKLPRLMLKKSKCQSPCKRKQQLEFGHVLKNDQNTRLLSEDTSFYNGQQESIHNKDQSDMWSMKDGLYTCKICKWRKRRPTTLLHHLMFHTGEMPFVCQSCCKWFNTRQRLKEHVHAHTGWLSLLMENISVFSLNK